MGSYPMYASCLQRRKTGGPFQPRAWLLRRLHSLRCLADKDASTPRQPASAAPILVELCSGTATLTACAVQFRLQGKVYLEEMHAVRCLLGIYVCVFMCVYVCTPRFVATPRTRQGQGRYVCVCSRWTLLQSRLAWLIAWLTTTASTCQTATPGVVSSTS
jgi:hypothetical protein